MKAQREANKIVRQTVRATERQTKIAQQNATWRADRKQWNSESLAHLLQ